MDSTVTADAVFLGTSVTKACSSTELRKFREFLTQNSFGRFFLFETFAGFSSNYIAYSTMI